MAQKKHPADLFTESLYQTENADVGQSLKGARIVLLSALCATLTALGVWLCVAPTKSFSEQENRLLAERPSFSVADLGSGKWSKDLAAFCTDQFPMRSLFIPVKAGTELALGKAENNDVLLGEDGYLFPRPDNNEAAQENLSANLHAISAFTSAVEASGIPCHTVIIPRSADANAAKLPALFDRTSYDLVWDRLADAAKAEGLPYASLTDPLRAAAERGEEVYYRTDHHWTSTGAYRTYLALADILGYKPFGESDFTPETVSTDFSGTAQSASGMAWVDRDEIVLWRYAGDDAKKVEIFEANTVKTTLDGLYDFSFLDVKDQYSVFLGGTNTVIRVTDTEHPDLPTLVLIKDSFSQSLAPFLARHYNLLLIDPRTYKPAQGSVFAAATQASPEAVLVLFGIDTLTEAKNAAILSLGLPQK